MTPSIRLLSIVGILSITSLCPDLYADVVAPSTNSPMGMQLYYLSAQGNLMRGDCNVNTRLYNRGNCATNLAQMPAQTFYDQIFATYGNQAEAYETRVVEDYARMLDVDRLLKEFIDVTPNPQGQDLLPRIREKEELLATQALTVSQLVEQKTRVQEGLALDPASSNLQQQYILLTTQLSEATLAAEATRTDLAALNRSYIQANSQLISEEEFDTLSRQREALDADMQTYTNLHKLQLEWRRHAVRSINMMQNHNAVYEAPPATGFNPDVFYVLQGYGQCFDYAMTMMKSPSFVRDPANPMRLMLNQPFDFIVDQINCSFDISIVECSNPKVTLTSGEGYTAVFDGTGPYLFESPFRDYPSPEWPNYIGHNGRGLWSAVLSCDQGTPAHAADWSAICTLQLR